MGGTKREQSGPVAQRLEQGTHNPLAGGSNPSGPIVLILTGIAMDCPEWQNPLFCFAILAVC